MKTEMTSGACPKILSTKNILRLYLYFVKKKKRIFKNYIEINFQKITNIGINLFFFTIRNLIFFIQ